MDTFSVYREEIERELSEIVQLVKKDPKVDGRNVFAIGFSNGGFWASYLAGTQKVNAGASHYGVWKANMGRSIENPFPMEYFTKDSNPVLALHGADDGTQRMRHVQQAWDIVSSSGANITTHVYPGADHAWDSKSKRFDAWNPQITQDALKRTITFFESNLQKWQNTGERVGKLKKLGLQPTFSSTSYERARHGAALLRLNDASSPQGSWGARR